MTCPNCNSTNTTQNGTDVISAPYMQTELNGELLYLATITTYSTCNNCGLVFQNNIKSQEWYDWFYSSGTYRKTLGLPDDRMNSDEKQRAKRVMEWLSISGIQVHSHKDYGSSRGYFLNETREHYHCQIMGDDPMSDYGLMTFDDMPDRPDLVSAIHVLEHVVDPAAKLQAMAKETTRYLLIEVPGKNTLGGALRFAHLYYFPPELLMNMVINAGMKIVVMEAGDNTRILAEKVLDK